MTQATPPTQPNDAMVTPEQQRAKDASHLDLLSIFNYVLAGLLALFGCFPIMHIVIGIMAINEVGIFATDEDMPALFGWMFLIMGSLSMAFMWSIATLSFFTGRRLKRRRGYRFCFVASCIQCIVFPIGTTLGVFSLIVLMRDSVKQVFAERADAYRTTITT